MVAGVGGLVFVIARWAVAAHGDITVFIVAGSTHASPSPLIGHIALEAGSGYDGQFYYRIALDPADLARSAFGIRLDSLSRLERIGYPAIAWVLAAGRSWLVPYTLVATNIIALSALGLGGGLLARESGRHPMWGLALAGYWGYLWSTGRDLTEITAAAFLVLGLVAYRRQRPLLAGLALLGAVLSKETAAYVVAIIAICRLTGWIARRDVRPPGVIDATWAVPATGFVGWQLAVFSATGTVPLLSSGNANLTWPVTGLANGVRHYITALPSVASLAWTGELAVLIALVIAAGVSLRHSSVPTYEKFVWLAVAILAICTAPGIWLGDVGFRSLDDVYLFSWIVLLGSPRRLVPLGVLLAGTWVLVALELIKYV
jgi:hypothetical protein